jgi:hypothetical protein
LSLAGDRRGREITIKDSHERRPTPTHSRRHDCEWRDEVERLWGQVDELKTTVEQIRAEMESMKRRLLGPKTEKIKPIGHEVRDKVGVDPAAAQEARLANAKLRSARVVTERVEHKVPDDQRKCPKCGRRAIRQLTLPHLGPFRGPCRKTHRKIATATTREHPSWLGALRHLTGVRVRQCWTSPFGDRAAVLVELPAYVPERSGIRRDRVSHVIVSHNRNTG